MKNIILIGRMGSGKTTVAEYLEKKYGYTIVSFAKPIKQLAEEQFGMVEKDRALLQMIGKVGRAINSDTWIDFAKQTIDWNKEAKAFVIDDCRYENEFDEFVFKHAFIPIFIMSKEEIRIIRLINSGQEVSRKYLHDSSEKEVCKIIAKREFYKNYMDTSSYVIDNNLTIEQLYVYIDEVIEEIND